MTQITSPSVVALIPARAGSKRVPGKNTRLFAGKPLLVYTIEAAQQSGIFSDITVSTDSPETRQLAYDYGAHGMYRNAGAADGDPDILWVRDYFSRARAVQPDAFAILRPTSPFRTAETIRRAWQQFQERQPCDSLRAVEPTRGHPGKMWMCQRDRTLLPLLPYWTRTGNEASDTPWHSAPTQTLPVVYVQNASLEIAWTRVIRETGTISGHKVMPFFTEGLEGFDINTPEDWERAEHLMAIQPVEYLG